MLLEREDVNPNQADTGYGWTALSWAARNGHKGVVKMLLEREDVNPDHEDTKYGQTPLSLAAEKGHEGVVKMLLKRENVNPDQADTRHGRTPLAWAAENGHSRVVKILSKRQHVRPAVSDNKNQTALPLTLSEAHDEVVAITRDNINSQTTNCGGQASLPDSAGHGGECVVEMQSRAVDSDTGTIDLNAQHTLQSADPDDRPSLALPEAPDEVIRISQDNANSHTTNYGGQAPLLPSAENGGECVVEMQSRAADPGTDITELSAQTKLLSTDPDDGQGVLGHRDPVPNPAGTDLPTTKRSRFPRLRSICPLKFWCPLKKTSIPPGNA